jgi:DNA-binding response OmpR family regulator
MNQYTPDEPIQVLLVEDNPGDVRLTREAFDGIDSDVTFTVLTDGHAVTEFFQDTGADGERRHPDLVLLDLNLPRVDGFTVLQRLHAELEYPPPPVLVLTSSDAEEDVVKSYDNAANAYLRKPDDMSEFTAMASAIEEFWFDAVQHPPAPA